MPVHVGVAAYMSMHVGVGGVVTMPVHVGVAAYMPHARGRGRRRYHARARGRGVHPRGRAQWEIKASVPVQWRMASSQSPQCQAAVP